MKRYELLMLTIPEITGDEARNIESQLQTTVKNAGASLISFERWGKYNLAYPVKKNDYGIYYLARFESINNESALNINEIKNAVDVKFYDIVMRSMISAIDSKGSLAYQRPVSLEETPKRESSYLRSSSDEDSRSSGSVLGHDVDDLDDIEENHEVEGSAHDTKVA